MSTSSFTHLLEEDFRWPAIGDKLFSAEQPAYGAVLHHHPEERLYHLTDGYKLAADLLVQQLEPHRDGRAIYFRASATVRLRDAVQT